MKHSKVRLGLVTRVGLHMVNQMIVMLTRIILQAESSNYS
jgi:hypothetical protein